MRRNSVESPRLQGNPIHLNGHKRHPTISLKPKEPLKLKLDHMLHKDYENWRQDKTNFDVLNSQTAKNPQIIENYIQGIYIDYQIIDPLSKQSHYKPSSLPKHEFYQQKLNPQLHQQSQIKPRTNFTFGNNRYEQKVTFQSSVQNRNVYTTPQKSPQQNIQIMNSSTYGIGNKARFIQRTAPSLSSSFNLNDRGSFGTSTVNFTSFHTNNGSNNKDSGINKSRISIENRFSRHSQPLHLNFTPSKLTEKKYIHQQTEQSRKIHEDTFTKIFPSNNNRLSNSLKIQNQQKINWLSQSDISIPISDSYRYCIGCEMPILENNILYHEKICDEYQKIVKIDQIQSIINQIDRKINKICEEINKKKKEIKEKDYEEISISSSQLIEEIKKGNIYNIDQQENNLNFDVNYSKVIQIGKKWSLLTEEVNKLKWFLNIRKNMQQIQQIEKYK